MFVLSQCDFCAQHGGFVPQEWQAAKGLLTIQNWLVE